MGTATIHRPSVERRQDGSYCIVAAGYFHFVEKEVCGLNGVMRSERMKDIKDHECQFFMRDLAKPRVVTEVIRVFDHNDDLVVELRATPREGETEDMLLNHLTFMMEAHLN